MTTPTRDQIKAVLEEIRNGLGCHEEESEPIATEEDDEVLSGDSSLGHFCDNVNYLACLETRQYVWVGRLDPQGAVPVADVGGSIAMFALENRNKPLIVVSESHPILEEGMEWSPLTT